MNKIEQTYIIAASPKKIWRALTDARVIRKWSGADAVFPLKPGAAYSLWDGSITGEVLAIVPEKKLAQSWKPDNWTITNSVVTFTLTPTREGTRVDLLHENIEEWDYEGTETGWDNYYLGAIKRMFSAEPAKPRITKTAKSGNTKTAKKVKTVKGKRVAGKKEPVKKPTGRARAKS
ncbi:MAG: SRPBCC domain-containing protein [Chloroflexi bacterium]|nr:SRPBCC domain-containing protein [Chloroflexota bacterium]